MMRVTSGHVQLAIAFATCLSFFSAALSAEQFSSLRVREKRREWGGWGEEIGA